MKMMSYNIRLGIQEGVDAVAQLIQHIDPDILAIQEVGRHWTNGPSGDTTQKICDQTALKHAIYVPAIIEGDAQYGHALLSKYPLATLSNTLLPQNEDEPRRLLVAQAQISQTFTPIILSTHLSWLDSDRPQQASILTNAFAHQQQTNDHVFIMGDLNEHHDVSWIETLIEHNQDADQTLQRLTFPSKAPKIRLDYLIANHGKWHDTQIIEDSLTSDHFAVCATWSTH